MVQVHRVVVDNRNRDLAQDSDPGKHVDGNDSSPFDYQIKLSSLSSILKDVTSMTVRCLCMMRPMHEDWIAVRISPFDDAIMSSDNASSGATIVLAYENWQRSARTVSLVADHIFGAVCEAQPPIGRLDRLDVRFTKFGGATLSHADFIDDDGVLVDGWDRHSLFLEFTTNDGNTCRVHGRT